MMRELRRLWSGLLVWLILAGTVGLNGVLAFYQRRYGPESYWGVMGQFWDKLGLAAVAAAVLTACLPLTACDRICRTEELVLTARLGRRHLFVSRMAACALGTVLFVLALSVGNFLCGKVVADGLRCRPAGEASIWAAHCWRGREARFWRWQPADCASGSDPCPPRFFWRLWCCCSAP